MRCGPVSSRWPQVTRRPCSRGSSRILTTGAPRSARRSPCRTSRWCCTAAATPMAADLADLAALGPYFEVDVHHPGAPPRPPWQPLGDLVSSPGALAVRIGEVRERLAAAAGCPPAGVEFRVAASIAQLGLCARLLSPALGAAAVGRTLPVDIAQARWVPALGGPFRLSLPDTVLE